MKVSDHIKNSLDAAGSGELDRALLHLCIAIDGTASKFYPELSGQGNARKRFIKFINDYLDIIELLYGGVNLRETVFPFKNSKGNKGITFAELIYEKFRCYLAHGEELPYGYMVTPQIQPGMQNFRINTQEGYMTLPQSVIYALGLACVLCPANNDQKIGSSQYWFNDPINTYVIDEWWGKVELARSIMDFETPVKVTFKYPTE